MRIHLNIIMNIPKFGTQNYSKIQKTKGEHGVRNNNGIQFI